MIGIVFNHSMFDSPYNFAKVRKGMKALEKLLGNYGKYYMSFGKKRSEPFLEPDYEDEYVLVHHTVNLNFEQKTQIANAIKETLPLKRTVYKGDLPDICIVFEKIAEENYFSF